VRIEGSTAIVEVRDVPTSGSGSAADSVNDITLQLHPAMPRGEQ
jgi:hypothetical protein